MDSSKRHGVSAVRGFTLVGVLVTLLVVGILTVAAVVSYRHYVTASSIKVGQAALLQQAQDLSQFAQDNDTYVGGCSQPVQAANWSLSCPTLSGSSYVIRATGSGAAAGFVFTLDEHGARATTSAPSGWTTSGSCWVVDASGDCADG